MNGWLGARVKLEPGNCGAYQLPDCGKIVSVVLDDGYNDRPDGMLCEVMHINPADWARMRGDPNKEPHRGRPTYFAWVGEGVVVYPAPDKPYELRVRYFPHMREA
jgi:hypothetical protein